MINFALGYSLICTAIFLVIISISNLNFSFSSARTKEIRNAIAVRKDTFKKVNKVFSNRTKQTQLELYDEWLTKMRNPYGLTGIIYLTIQVVFTIFTVFLFLIFILNSSLYDGIRETSFIGVIGMWIFLFLASVLVFLIPTILLKTFYFRNKSKLERQFIFLLNYFQIYLRLNYSPVDIVKTVLPFIPNPLNKYLIDLYAEIQVHGSRKAFTAFGEKLDFSGANTFKTNILNSLVLGSDAAAACQNLSSNMRGNRKKDIILTIQNKPFLVLLPKICFVIAALLVITIPLIHKVFSISAF